VHIDCLRCGERLEQQPNPMYNLFLRTYQMLPNATTLINQRFTLEDPYGEEQWDD